MLYKAYLNGNSLNTKPGWRWLNEWWHSINYTFHLKARHTPSVIIRRGEYKFVLTHRSLKKIAVILHTTISNAFSRKKLLILLHFVSNRAIDNRTEAIRMMARQWTDMSTHNVHQRNLVYFRMYIYIYISLKQHGHFATNGFVFPLIRQMLQNTKKNQL